MYKPYIRGISRWIPPNTTYGVAQTPWHNLHGCKVNYGHDYRLLKRKILFFDIDFSEIL